MSWKNRNVFVTGADGFIGAWLVKRLVEEKANVIVLIRDVKQPATYKLLNLEKKVTQAQGDIIDYNLMARLLNEYSIDSCFHLAAQALVQIANRSPISTFESNIKGTWNILEACRNTKTIKRIITASTDKAYGEQKDLPYTEDSPLLGLYPYDASKACADILARSYAVSYDLPIAVTRNANTYGGGDLNSSRIIPDAICSILQGKEFLIRSDGTPEREYMYVEDAVDGYLTLAEAVDKKNVRAQAFNFSTGEVLNAVDLFKKIAKLCAKPKAKMKVLGVAKNEIDKQYLSSKKAAEVLKWKPRYDLESGLKRTIKWYKKYLKV
ncbi:MAG: GDP-mannose 4,6-dehydratase [Candidatus Omnitrophica bacterium]|nr:GDP-mannose 4,6-dehydratase [Candidatus Omnitrophota bacterium]